MVEQSREEVTVHCVSVSDCVEALQKHASRPQDSVGEHIKYLAIDPVMDCSWLDQYRERRGLSSSAVAALFDTLDTAYRRIETITFRPNLELYCINCLPCIHLLDHLVTLSGNIPDIVIQDGEITLDDLHRWWCEAGHRYQGRVTLDNLMIETLLFNDELDDQLVQWDEKPLSQDLARAMRECVQYPTNTVLLGENISFTLNPMFFL